jgi:hypothetical protein
MSSRLLGRQALNTEIIPVPDLVRGHRHQKVVEVARNSAGQMANRFHFLRLIKSLAGLVESQLSFLALGNVPGDFGEAKFRCCPATDR